MPSTVRPIHVYLLKYPLTGRLRQEKRAQHAFATWGDLAEILRCRIEGQRHQFSAMKMNVTIHRASADSCLVLDRGHLLYTEAIKRCRPAWLSS